VFQRGGPPTAAPSVLLFGGVDLWRYGDLLCDGAVWSPAGPDAEGFTLKLLASGGRYTYTSGDLHAEVGELDVG